MTEIKSDKTTQKLFEPEAQWVLLSRYQRALLEIEALKKRIAELEATHDPRN